MFENVLKELEKLKQKTRYSIPLEADEDGYIDKECPSENCLFQFKVHQDDWKNLFKEEEVYCPMCRHQANAQSWYTTDQINHGREQVKKQILSQLNNAFHRDGHSFNAKQRQNSFLKLRMNFTGSKAPAFVIPIPSKEEMELKIQCKECNARYSVIGSAFFCPCCGHNSAEETFDNSLKKIEAKIKNLDLIREALESISKDDAELTCRSLIETSLNDAVVAFQRFCEVTFKKHFPTIKVSFNAFQKLDTGSEYWKQLIGSGYSDWLTSLEYQHLKNLFQKRHLLSHTEGIIDQKYIDNTTDTAYKIGQRIVIRDSEVMQCLSLVKKVIDAIKSNV